MLAYTVLWLAAVSIATQGGTASAISPAMNTLLWTCYRAELIARFVLILLLLACLNRSRKRLRQEAKLAKQNWLPPGTQVGPTSHGDLS